MFTERHFVSHGYRWSFALTLADTVRLSSVALIATDWPICNSLNKKTWTTVERFNLNRIEVGKA